MDISERKQLAAVSIEWQGDLLDDCTAQWAGLMLRAEWMDEEWWWWAVYDMQRDEITIESSNRYDESFIGGIAAREKAESVARQYIDRITGAVAGQFFIGGIFKITDRGLFLAGNIQYGNASIGNIIEFSDGSELEYRKIIGIESILKSSSKETNTGILIDCKDESEIEYFRNNIEPNQIATIFNQ